MTGVASRAQGYNPNEFSSHDNVQSITHPYTPLHVRAFYRACCLPHAKPSRAGLTLILHEHGKNSVLRRAVKPGFLMADLWRFSGTFLASPIDCY